MTPEPGRKAYAGVTRNGVTSYNYGAFASSFRVAGAGDAAAPSASPAPSAASASTASVCPDNFDAYADTASPLSCTCSPEAAQSGQVWGMDVYTGDSGVCRSALHAGVIGKSGGAVTVTPLPGRNAYPGVTRNGVTSYNYGAFGSSFQVAGAGDARLSSSAASTLAVSVCPDNFDAYADTSAPLSCTCSPEADASWAGLGHGRLHRRFRRVPGGAARGRHRQDRRTVTVTPLPGRNAYAGVTRNGVTSYNYGAFASSFRFAQANPAPTQGTAPVKQPVQAPIAASLRDKGQVDLYIRFRTGSAEIDPAALSVLDELRSALIGAPDLNLALIGHTDNVGSREYNQSLSFRRAEAVRTWLAERSVSPARITVDGRGFDEPLRDNATEEGRAFNRRVQAKRLQVSYRPLQPLSWKKL